MKYTRSTKCYFSKWITETKQVSIREFITEMHRVVEWVIIKYESDIINGMKKSQLLLACNLDKCDSWLTARAKKNAFAEAHALVPQIKSMVYSHKLIQSRINRNDTSIKILKA